MELVLIIFAILILGKISKPDSRREFKVVSGALLGISYFFIWPYIYYYLELLNWDNSYIQISFVTFVVISMLIIKYLLEIDAQEILKVFLIVFFIFFWIGSSVYEIEIKDKLADISGFFPNKLLVGNNANKLQKVITSYKRSYSINVPENWEEHKHKITNHSFYNPKENTSSIVEFRPRCYDKQNRSISELVSGMAAAIKENESSGYACYTWFDHGYACKITVNNKVGETRRIRWFGASKNTKRIFELDFITLNTNKKDLQMIDSIFESVKLTNISNDASSCVYPIDWF